MYCIRCGKKIENGTVCGECIAAEATMNTDRAPTNGLASLENMSATEIGRAEFARTAIYVEEETQPTPTKSRMAGFGMALTATILSFFGFLIAYIGYIVGLFAPEGGIALAFASLPFIVLPVIFGIISIGRFKNTKAPDPKPIPTLILGIEGVATASGALIFAILAVVVSSVMIM